MKRVTVLFQLKSPELAEEYHRRHAEIWPSVADAIRRAGIRNYSIWNHGEILFGYYEVDDQARAAKILASEPDFSRWREWMREVIYYDQADKAEDYMSLMFLSE